MLTISAILTAAASGPDAVTALCAPLSDDDLRAEIEQIADQSTCPSCRRDNVPIREDRSRVHHYRGDDVASGPCENRDPWTGDADPRKRHRVRLVLSVELTRRSTP